MNAKINKAIEEIERTKAKLAELQALLPELERRRAEMENTEIIRLVRSANIAPADFPEFVAALKAAKAPVPAHAETIAAARDTSGDSAADAVSGFESDAEGTGAYGNADSYTADYNEEGNTHA